MSSFFLQNVVVVGVVTEAVVEEGEEDETDMVMITGEMVTGEDHKITEGEEGAEVTTEGDLKKSSKKQLQVSTKEI